jgi:gluconolactonase
VRFHKSFSGIADQFGAIAPSLLILILLGATVSSADDQPAAKTKEVKARDMTLVVPEGWKSKPQVREPRVAEFEIPATEEGKEKGEFVVFYFGKQGAGGVQANIERWVGQFEAEGRMVKTLTGESAEGKYTLVDLTGTYKKPIGPPIMRQSKSMPGWRVLNVVVETKAGPYFLKIDGPEKLIAAIEADFRNSFGGKKETEKEQKAE